MLTRRRRNRLQGLLLLGGMVVTLAVAALPYFGVVGLGWVLVVGGASVALRPRVPADWVLRMYRARPLSPTAAPGVHDLVRALARRAGLTHVPTVHYVPSSMLNAFAVGRPDDAAVALTDGMLRALGPRQLAGVLAHEISHVRSGDLRIMTLADAVSRLTHLFAYAGLLLLLFGLSPMVVGDPVTDLVLTAAVLVAVPTVVTLLQAALSRAREYDADLAAAELTGDPLGLASALEVIGRAEGRVWERIMVPHRRGPDAMLLRTHPPTEERVRRLRALAPPSPPMPMPPVVGPPDGAVPVGGPPRLRLTGVWR